MPYRRTRDTESMDRILLRAVQLQGQWRSINTVKEGTVTSIQERSGKCHTEELEILNRWPKYCFELYNDKANGDPSVLNCPQTDAEDDHPILRKEVQAVVQSLKKRKSAGVDSTSEKLVRAGGEAVITSLVKLCNKI